MSGPGRPRRPRRDVPWMPPELADEDGLVGVGGDLSPATLLRAYSEGVFPWFNDGDPILWWSPDPRGVMELDGLHVSRRLARTIRGGKFRVTADQCFERVMRACGETRPEGTWVTEEMVAAYTELHRRGHAHSLEVWAGGELVGGLYGVGVGRVFTGESMFHLASDASKVALVDLVARLAEAGGQLVDVQMVTPHLASLGARDLPRADFLDLLARVRDDPVRLAPDRLPVARLA